MRLCGIQVVHCSITGSRTVLGIDFTIHTIAFIELCAVTSVRLRNAVVAVSYPGLDLYLFRHQPVGLVTLKSYQPKIVFNLPITVICLTFGKSACQPDWYLSNFTCPPAYVQPCSYRMCNSFALVRFYPPIKVNFPGWRV